SLSWSTIREYTPLHVLKWTGIVVIATVVATRLVMLPNIRFQQLLPIVVAIGFAIHAGDWLTGYPLVELVAGPAIDRRISPSIVSRSLLLWPAVASLVIAQRRAQALLLWLFAGVVALMSPSGAAILGFSLGSVVLLIAQLLPR